MASKAPSPVKLVIELPTDGESSTTYLINTLPPGVTHRASRIYVVNDDGSERRVK